jgi:pantothenate kinase
MDFLVRQANQVKVKVYAWVGEDENIEASHEEHAVPDQAVDPELIIFDFKRPGHGDSTAIMRAAQVVAQSDDTTPAIDVPMFQDTVLKALLQSWDLKDKKGNEIKFNRANVDRLQPAIARAAIEGVLAVVNL